MNVGHKLHAYRNGDISLPILASSSFNIKREEAWLEATCLRDQMSREQAVFARDEDGGLSLLDVVKKFKPVSNHSTHK